MVLWDLPDWNSAPGGDATPNGKWGAAGGSGACDPLQYCSIKAGAMVSKSIADYAVVPDLHAAVFLVRAD